MDKKQRRLTPEELRKRNEAVMSRLLVHRVVLASVAFFGAMVETKNFRTAFKEARHAWRLELFQRD
jgi:hypothetical protein